MIWLALWLALAVATAKWLRFRVPWFQRFNDFNWQVLVTADVIAAFVLFWALYLVGVLDDRPLPWGTISSTCGRYAALGRGWARNLAAVIDTIFLALTGQRGHCAKAYARWASPLG